MQVQPFEGCVWEALGLIRGLSENGHSYHDCIPMLNYLPEGEYTHIRINPLFPGLQRRISHVHSTPVKVETTRNFFPTVPPDASQAGSVTTQRCQLS